MTDSQMNFQRDNVRVFYLNSLEWYSLWKVPAVNIPEWRKIQEM